MKIIFFGTSNFAVCILRELFQNRHNISSVVTAQDKKKGRGQKIAFSAVKVFAQKENLSILQPRSQRDYKFQPGLLGAGQKPAEKAQHSVGEHK